MNTQRSYWPYGIVLAFALFIGGTVALIVIACTHRTDLITSDYYADELRFQLRLDEVNRSARLADKVEVSFDTVRQSIFLTLPPAMVNAVSTGEIQLYRPSAIDRDVVVQLQLDPTGTQMIDATTLLPGLWKVRVHWTARSQDYFVDKSVLIKRGS